jgi:paraquat-inducible protein B
VLPGAGTSNNFMDSLNDVAGKLDQIHFEEIGNNLNHLLTTADKMISGPDMQQSLRDLSTAMSNAADLSRKANANMTPALEKLPDVSNQLRSAVTHANELFSGLQSGYGDGSDFQRDSKRVLDQANDAARSIRLLADYLERHPEALLNGKSPEKPKP